MENAELEVALEELESRLERLRALYEQYFMGIERIEPAIPRKDIDRRIYILRREKIRNTAKRFKLQTIISRYNTFQQYWQRICREIENGTYKRHVIRAERIAPGKMLTIAARKRLGRAALEAMEPDEAAPRAPASEAPPPSAKPAPSPAAAAKLRPSAVPPAAANPAAPLPAAASATSSRLAPPPKPVPPPKPGARPEKPSPPAAAARPAFESLDLDMDFLGDWDPAVAAAKPPAARRPPEVSAAAKRAPQVPARPFGKPLSRPLNTPPTPQTTNNELKAPPLQAAKPNVGADAPATRPGLPPLRSAAAMPARPAAPAAAPAAPAATRAPDALPPRAPAAPPPRPAPPPPAARPLGALVPQTSGARPPPPKPAVPAAPAAHAVSDDRVRELHARLVEAKRQTQDAASVSMEGLAKSMKATEAKLREQHKNRKIDFDVVIKDGKAVLKPIVR